VTGTAAHVAYFATSYDCSSEAIEQFPVEWLVLKFAGNSARVFVGHLIVASANRFGVVVHMVLLENNSRVLALVAC
jgi:hypothetical protein